MRPLKICALALWSIFALAAAREAGAADVVVKRFDSGDGSNAVGVIEASEDTEIDGPQALTTDDNGDVYLLDQVNARIVSFDPKSPAAEPRIQSFPDQLQPTDLVVRKADILVWDGSIHTLQARTGSDNTSYRGLEEVNTRAADDRAVVSAFAQMGSVEPVSSTDLLDAHTRAVSAARILPRPRQYVASRGAGTVVVDVNTGSDRSRAEIEVRRQAAADAAPMARLGMRVRDRLGAIEFLEVDRNGRMYVFAENIPASGGKAGAFVARYSPAGVIEGVYELPLVNVPLSRRFVAVSVNGDVYFLRTQSGGVEILGVGFRPMAGDKVIDIRTAAAPPPAAVPAHGMSTAVLPLTRQRVVETAFAFEQIQWLVNPSAYGSDPDTVCTGFNGRIRRPAYIQGKMGQQVRGVPYCWGCHGSLDLIRNRIEHGVLAGNICTHNDPRSDTTGVDCSAFVSAAWGLSTHFTTVAIPSITQPVTDISDLRPGDAFNKPGSHVMLFLRFTPSHMAEVMESSPGGCPGRVCRNVYPLASLLARGYQPVRFRALVNDTGEGAVGAEIPPPEKDESKAQKAAQPVPKAAQAVQKAPRRERASHPPTEQQQQWQERQQWQEQQQWQPQQQWQRQQQ
jgi:hypothetical protein